MTASPGGKNVVQSRCASFRTEFRKRSERSHHPEDYRLTMKMLLENRLAPLTFSWGFLETTLDVAVDGLCEWRKMHAWTLEAKHVRGEFESILHLLEPLSAPPSRELLIPTRSEWTAYFDNKLIGGEPQNPIGVLTQRLDCRGVTVSCIPNTLSSARGNRRGTYGSIDFSLFAPEPREWLNYERSVGVFNDGGKWRFIDVGSVQPFERTEVYEAKRVADRFSSELLEEYCASIGIDLFNPDFYGLEGLLVQWTTARLADYRMLTLREAQDGIAVEE